MTNSTEQYLIDTLNRIYKISKSAGDYQGDRLSPEEVYMGAVSQIKSISGKALRDLGEIQCQTQ